jgi:CO/xanthine dehydrogenase FAD-binding subunit
MTHLEYHEPNTIRDACSLLSEFGKEASILAGGTDLVIQMKRGRLSPKHLVNIKRIEGLDAIHEEAGGFRLGALVTIADIATHAGLRLALPMVVNSAQSIGSLQIRNVATIGGNLCNASPAADMAPSLLVLEAEVCIAGPHGSRTIPITDFFVGPGKVDLQADEFLVEIRIPNPVKNTKMVFYKLGPRKAMDCSVVSVAAAMCLNPSTGACEKARIALGAVSRTPVRVRRAERLIEGKVADKIPLTQIAEAIRQEIHPISDVRASAGYRYETAVNLAMRAVRSLLNSSEE